jgi:3-oxoadipate enol-lactonase
MPFADLPGARVYYETAGSGHPVVFMHGSCLDSRMWDWQVDRVSQSYTVVRFDFRGHGRSGAPDTGYSRPCLVEELRGLLDHLGIHRPSLVGHSMGGSVALEYATTYPDKVTTLTLVDSGLEGYGVRPESFQRKFEERRRMIAKEGVTDRFVRAVLGSRLYAGVRRQPEVKTLVEDMLRRWSGLDWLEERDRGREQQHLVKQVGVPTLALVGEEDQARFHDIADLFTREIRVVRKELIPEAGHMAPMENPEAFNDILVDFLGGAVGKALI